jgi:hypothetical protein
MSFVLIHIGPLFPDYINTCIKQIRLFNPTKPIYIVSNQQFKNNILNSNIDSNIIFEPLENIQISQQHQIFNQTTRLDRYTKGGFWKYTTERFFYLNYVIQKYHLEDIIHLENDNMVYFDLNELLPIFHKYYQIGATLDNDNRCIPGIMYIKNEIFSQQIVDFIVDNINTYGNDMILIAQIRQKTDFVQHLPIIDSNYSYPLISPEGHSGNYKTDYYNHCDEFQSIFDGAAIGQYLGGVDPKNIAGDSRGFINESCVVNYSKVLIIWERDMQNRRIPYVLSNNTKYRINNLHIHCKNLDLFLSS